MTRPDDSEDRYHRKLKREQRQRDQLPTDDQPSLPPPIEPIETDQKTGRNDPCPCGSGKKYKKCCGAKN